jgi:hypothetical protein
MNAISHRRSGIWILVCGAITFAAIVWIRLDGEQTLAPVHMTTNRAPVMDAGAAPPSAPQSFVAEGKAPTDDKQPPSVDRAQEAAAAAAAAAVEANQNYESR